MTDDPGEQPHARIAVLGPCASGKSTLTEILRERGYDARAIGQEHSGVRRLWDHVDPDVLIVLEIDLETLRSRRNPSWPEDIYHRQMERLDIARDEADLILDTSSMDPIQAADAIEQLLRDGSAS